MPTTSRSGNTLARVSSAIRSAGSLNVGNEHEPVGDVEVGVAGRQPLAFEDDRPGHRQLDDAQRLAVLVARRSAGGEGFPGAVRGWGRRQRGSTTVTTVCGSTNRARSSTWPCVSSPSIPRPSQTTWRDSQVVGEDPLDACAVETRDCAPGRR